LNRFCRDWLDTRRHELKPATVDLYEQTIDRLCEYFNKGLRLRQITPKSAATFLAQVTSRANGYEGQELSPWTREQIKRHCKTIFGAAVTWGLLENNPFKTLRGMKPSVRRWHRVKVSEYHALLEVAPTLRWRVFYALAYTSGARSGELLSLTWNDIDFENGRLIIDNRKGTNDMPPFHVKDHEARRIPLPDHTVDLLTELQAEAPEGVPYVLLTRKRYEKVRAKWQKLQTEGKQWRNRYMVNNVLRNFKQHFKRAGIKPVAKLTIHTLRKSCGQNWADYLPMNVVKELMGHSSIETTAEFYNQVDADHEAKAAAVVQRLVMGTDSQTQSNNADVQTDVWGSSARNGGHD